MKKWTTVFVVMMLLIMMTVSVTLADVPSVTLQPQSQTVQAGGTIRLDAAADDYIGISWIFTDPVSGSSYLTRDIITMYPMMDVYGQNEGSLVISNIDAALNGWTVSCRFGNSSGAADTDAVTITVIGGEKSAAVTVKPEPVVTPEPVKVITLTAVNATLQNAKGKAISGNETEVTSLDAEYTVKSSKDVKYWVINGVKYYFPTKSKTLKLTNVDESLVVEAVTGNTSKTELSDSDVQNARTGEYLFVETVNAHFKMIKSKNKAGGSWATGFDFTENYTNTATKKQEKGGQLDLYVEAVIPKNNKVSGWKFNNVEIYTAKANKGFFVTNLNTCMVYEPIFTKTKTSKTTATPTPTPTVRITRVTPEQSTTRVTPEQSITRVTPEQSITRVTPVAVLEKVTPTPIAQRVPRVTDPPFTVELVPIVTATPASYALERPRVTPTPTATVFRRVNIINP